MIASHDTPNTQEQQDRIHNPYQDSKHGLTHDSPDKIENALGFGKTRQGKASDGSIPEEGARDGHYSTKR